MKGFFMRRRRRFNPNIERGSVRMSGKKEREAVYYYLSNLINSPISKSKQTDVLEWVEANSAELFGIDLYTIWDDNCHNT
jgi:hypothetical protein